MRPASLHGVGHENTAWLQRSAPRSFARPSPSTICCTRYSTERSFVCCERTRRRGSAGSVNTTWKYGAVTSQDGAG